MPSLSVSSSDIALSARGLSKAYTIQHNTRAQPTTLAETFVQQLRRPFAGRTATSEPGERRNTFWALRDVDFDIKRGEVVGVVGRNGSGKSTLLKLLSRITEPTRGRATLYGRVGSLLEVGTGFHPELTGRENIYLNGSILGMTRREVDNAFEAIVEFAEVSAFLDTPVKRYSSGMYVRLAFSVAAHLNPEILIVDEVLAVGDAAFQRKCLGKMNDVAREGGRTVLFVSHNMAAVRSLCSSALFLNKGVLSLNGDTESVVRRYVDDGVGSGSRVLWSDADGPDLRFNSGAVLNVNGEVADLIACSEPFTLEAEYDVKCDLSRLRIVCWMQTLDGVPLCCSYDPNYSVGRTPAGRYIARCTFPPYTLNGGRYLVRFEADIPDDRVLARTPEDLTVTVEDIDGHGLLAEKLPGLLRPRLDWEIAAGPVANRDAASA